MTGSAGIFPKNDGDTIYAADYNNIQDTVQTLLGTGLADSGYGQTVNSIQVVPDESVKVLEWNTVRGDLLKIRQHQTGVSESASLTVPVDGAVITNEFVNQYKTFATTCTTNRLVIATNQGQQEDFVSRQRTTAWNGVLTHTVTVTFASANASRHWFNAGGQFRFTASRSGGSTNDKNTAWTNLLSDMAIITFNVNGTSYSGTGASSVASSTGWYQLTTTNAKIFEKPAVAGVYNENDYNINARKNANDNTATELIFTIQFRDDDAGDQRPVDPGTLGVDGVGVAGPGVDENVDGTLTSVVRIFRPVGANVALSAPSVVESGL
jgi:hypothetical protein